MEIVPSVAMVTQRFAANGASAASASPTRACGTTVSARVRPAVSLMKRRRLIGRLLVWPAMASALARSTLDRADNAQIGAAAADIAVHVLDDLRPRRVLVARQEFRRLHDLTGLAVAALRHLLGDPGFLQRMAAVGRQAFYRGDRLALNERYRHGAGARRLAVDMHR